MVKHYHPLLNSAFSKLAAIQGLWVNWKYTAQPCNEEGDFLPEGAPAPPRDNIVDFSPFADRPSFEFVELAFEKMQVSKGDLDQLLHILAAKNVADGHAEQPAIFENTRELLETIDDIPYGDATWRAYKVRYTGPIDPDSPPWMRRTYTVHMRDTLVVAKQLVTSDDFKGKFNTRPFAEYLLNGARMYSDLMSGQWAYREAVSFAVTPVIPLLTLCPAQTKIAEDPRTHGAMLVPVILGADKTTVSVATGHQEYHPVYMSVGNVHNDMRWAHRDAVVPVASLAIPKSM